MRCRVGDVGEQVSALDSTCDGSNVVAHFLETQVILVRIAENISREAVAYKDHIDSAGILNLGSRIVVASQHRDADPVLFELLEFRSLIHEERYRQIILATNGNFYIH